MYISSSVWSAGLHLALLSLGPHFPPLNHGDQQNFQAAIGQRQLSGEKLEFLLEDEEAGGEGKGREREERE